MIFLKSALMRFHTTHHIYKFVVRKKSVRKYFFLWEISSAAPIKSLSRCRGMLQCIFLSDLVTADGRYLESFVFDPGPFKRWSNFCFPREGPTKGDWDTWFNFWHNYATTGGKLKVPLGRWTHPTHRKWLWYSSQSWGLNCLLLSTSTIQTSHALRSGILSRMERAAQSKPRDRRAGVSSGVRRNTCL